MSTQESVSPVGDTITAALSRLDSAMTAISQRLDTGIAVDITAVPETALHWTEWVQAVGAILSVIAAGGAVFVAYRALKTEWKRDSERDMERKARQAAVDSRIGAVGFAVKRQLDSWLREVPGAPAVERNVIDVFRDQSDNMNNKHPMIALLLDAADWAADRQRHFRPAEKRFEQMMVEAPEAGQAVAEAVRSSYVWFYNATDKMNQGVEARKQSHYMTCARMLVQAYDELRECVDRLATAIDPEMLTEQRLISVSNGSGMSEATRVEKPRVDSEPK